MNKYLIYISILFALGISACSKDNGPSVPTSMTTLVNNDTLWTTTRVVTDASSGFVFVNGTSPDGSQKVSLTIYDYKGRGGTFNIDYRGPGGNVGINMGQYSTETDLLVARGGKIIIEEVTNTYIAGTFEFFYLQTRVKGSFTAPAP